jgi:DNA-binding GntR family transcriptional regulator
VSTREGARGREGNAVRAVRAALVEGLVQSLAADIASGRIPLNSWLRQESIADTFGVSRTPVREALRVLQAKGMVEVVPNRGALVRGPTPREIREAYALRAELEGFAAELAAQWIRDSQLQQLREAEQLFQQSVDTFVRDRRSGEDLDDPDVADGERAGWMKANDLFHRAVHVAAGNLRLVAAIVDLHRTFPRNLTWSALSGDSRELLDNVRTHREIRVAIEERDSAEARKLMTGHIRRSGELVTMWFEQQVQQP